MTNKSPNPIVNEDVTILVVMGSNCTFMELKQPCTQGVVKILGGSNCTFMELKHRKQARVELAGVF